MRIAAVPLLCLAAAGCAPASTYQPRVDLAGANAARFQIDLYDCKRVAERDRYGPLLAYTLMGAGLGTAAGAAVAGVAATGNVGLAESYGAIGGTVIGAGAGAHASGGQANPTDEKRFVDQCLRNNGYKVLD